MAKTKTETKTFDNNVMDKVEDRIEDKIEDKPTVDSSLEVLQTQLKDYRQNAEHFTKMALKCEGAIEVLIQLRESEEDSK